MSNRVVSIAISEFLCHLLCPSDIRRLGFFVAATQHDDENIATLHKNRVDIRDRG